MEQLDRDRKLLKTLIDVYGIEEIRKTVNESIEYKPENIAEKYISMLDACTTIVDNNLEIKKLLLSSDDEELKLYSAKIPLIKKAMYILTDVVNILETE